MDDEKSRAIHTAGASRERDRHEVRTREAHGDAHPLDFYDQIPINDNFEQLGDGDLYQPLPGDWVVGVADIEGSTAAVEKGHYKAVNTIAASVIAAVANEIDDRDFPFVFAGDGASFALPPELADIGRGGLRAVARWAEASFGFHLRIAMTSVGELRRRGRDVRVARFGVSGDVAYAMFAGGGVSFAESRMKQGDYLLEPAEPGDPGPNLTGLSCRFSPIPTRFGQIVSIIVFPCDGVDESRFGELVSQVLAMVAETEAAGRPVPDDGPVQVWPSAGHLVEAKAAAARDGTPLWKSWLSVGVRSFLAHLTFKSGRKVGDFEPGRYRAELVRNTDFRKFDDGLRLTLDCTDATADELEALLRQADDAGIARAGMHRQAAALMTCFVPSANRSDHVHFVDGAMGGYAVAAQAAFRERGAL